MARNRIFGYRPFHKDSQQPPPPPPPPARPDDPGAGIGWVDALPNDEAWHLCQRLWQRCVGGDLDDFLRSLAAVVRERDHDVRFDEELARERERFHEQVQKLLELFDEFRRLSADDRRRIADKLARFARGRQPKRRDAMMEALKTRIDADPDESWHDRYFAMRKQFPREMKTIRSKESLDTAYTRWHRRRSELLDRALARWLREAAPPGR
jgi:hypothetical protein